MTNEKFKNLMENTDFPDEPDFSGKMEDIYAAFASRGYDEDFETFLYEVNKAREQIADENGELREEYLDMVSGGRTSWSCSVRASAGVSVHAHAGHYTVAFYVSVAVCISVHRCR